MIIEKILSNNFYGFLILLMAAILYWYHFNEPAFLFFGAGSTLLGISNKNTQNTTTLGPTVVSEKAVIEGKNGNA